MYILWTLFEIYTTLYGTVTHFMKIISTKTDGKLFIVIQQLKGEHIVMAAHLENGIITPT